MIRPFFHYGLIPTDAGTDLSTSSWPGLSRPSTSFGAAIKKVVDARHKAGHDESLALAAGL